MKVKLIFIVVLIVFFTKVKAQDPVFTEFFAVPETLNPGFTGFETTWHAGLLHRRQWPNGNRRIDTEFAFLNAMATDRVAVGGTILYHREEFTNYKYLQINGTFSYSIALNDEWGFSPGLEVGWGNKNVDFSNLLLEDQIDINTGAINGGSVDPGFLRNNDKIDFLDVSAGFVINNEQAWIGASLRHLNRPNIAFTEGGNVQLDMFLTIHGGYYFELDDSPLSFFPEESRIMVMANYMRQSQYNRLDIGGAFEAGYFTIGALAATNPERKSTYSHFITSINPFASFKLGEFTFGYSYDLNTSRIGNTQGVHEISLVWTSHHVCNTCDNYKVKLKRNGEAGYQRN